MTTRRNFLKGAAASAIIAISSRSKAEASYTPFAGVIYTSDSPGQWAQKVGGHAPIISKNGQKVTISTKHPMSASHFIVRHTLVLADGTVVGSKTFAPTDTQAVSTFDLPAGASKFYATSFCNIHDFWVTEGA